MDGSLKTLDFLTILSQKHVDLCDPLVSQIVSKILLKKKKSAIEISVLKKALSSVHFLSDLKKKMQKNDYNTLFSFLSFESMLKGQAACHLGEKGNKFYVILEGSVLVLIRDKKNEVKSSYYSSGFSTPRSGESEDELRMKGEAALLNLPENEPISIEMAEEAFPGFCVTGEIFAGRTFGEIALLENKRRQATVICKENCKFAVLTKAPFKRLISDIKIQETNEKTEFLSHFSIFNFWKDFNTLSTIPYFLEEFSFKRGQTIYTKGSEVKSFFLLKSGEVEIIEEQSIMNEGEKALYSLASNAGVTDPRFLDMNKKWQRTFKGLVNGVVSHGSKAPSFFGEHEIVSGLKKRVNTVLCKTNVVVYSLPKERMQYILAIRDSQFLSQLKTESEKKRTFKENLLTKTKNIKIQSISLHL